MPRSKVTAKAAEQAHLLLLTLTYLAIATEEGGQVSGLHLHCLLDGAVELLHELGGFEDVLLQYCARPDD